MAQVARILVVDDHPVARKTISALLRAQPDFEVISGGAADGVEAVERAKDFQPDVVVLDIICLAWTDLRQPPHKESCSRGRDSLSEPARLGETVRQAFRAGGRGYVVKSDAGKELTEAVRTVSNKKPYVNARFAAQL